MAIIKRVGILTGASGSTGKQSPGSSPASKSGITIKTRGNKTIISVKKDKVKKVTRRQREQRDKYCTCDQAYRILTPVQKQALRNYAGDMNFKHKTGLTGHQWWMKLCLLGLLDEVFQEYMGYTISDLIVETGEDQTCYTAYIQKAGKEYISFEDILDIASKRL